MDPLLRPEQQSRSHVLGSEPEPYAQPSNTSSLQSYYTALNAWQSNTSSQAYYSADSSPSFTNSASTRSSSMSFPYSETSINSYKSRKNVLYPRRAHPLPIAVSSSEQSFSISPDVLICQVRSICTTLLPHTETRLVPAGRVLLQSLEFHGDFSQHVLVRVDEETRCCAELFIALTREVLLKDAIDVGALERPCELLHLIFRDILFESEAFDTPTPPNLNVAGLFREPRAETQGPERFPEALNMINTPALSEEALREHHDQVSLKFSLVKDLTIDQYRKVLGRRLAQTHPLHPQAISTIEEVPEATDEWDLVDSNSRSCSNKRSFPRRFLCRFSPLSWLLEKKEGKKKRK
ncbi:hypothetical protein BJY52DRAFT_1257412 [Lactarius psammicola]|nr:hypothetical protein BJY52DRAFT_1257412 [Lactarius psammicola]